MPAGTPLDRAAIAALIPHAGAMCLLDTVDSWDALRLTACATSHRSRTNPLRRHGRLAAIHLIEYAAQAMAVHGGLAAQLVGRTARPGLLAGVRDVRLHVERIDDLAGDLTLRVVQEMAATTGWVYRFDAMVDRRPLAEGRVTIMTAAAGSA
ncbi:MAG TPA: hypothetical protein VF265_00850 [Nevskiaceae bacterium]